jgi:hypothetical protein
VLDVADYAVHSAREGGITALESAETFPNLDKVRFDLHDIATDGAQERSNSSRLQSLVFVLAWRSSAAPGVLSAWPAWRGSSVWQAIGLVAICSAWGSLSACRSPRLRAPLGLRACVGGSVRGMAGFLMSPPDGLPCRLTSRDRLEPDQELTHRAQRSAPPGTSGSWPAPPTQRCHSSGVIKASAPGTGAFNSPGSPRQQPSTHRPADQALHLATAAAKPHVAGSPAKPG